MFYVDEHEKDLDGKRIVPSDDKISIPIKHFALNEIVA